jgi:hypothetical protein
MLLQVASGPICVVVLLYVCIYVSSCYYLCVYMCPRTTMCVYIRVLVLLYVCIYVSFYVSTRVFSPLYLSTYRLIYE